MQYRNGKIISTGAAVSLNLGFVPDRFTVSNYTALTTDATAVIESTFYNGFTPAAGAVQITKAITTGALSEANITTNGFTAVNLGGVWSNTIYTITTISNASPGVVTIAGLTPTGGVALANGMTVTVSGVVGMQGINTQRFIVSNLTIVGGGPTYTFTLYDLFGNPFSTVGLGTYVSGGELDMISYPPTAPVLDPVNGQVITPGSPAGLQLDAGYQGITLGTSVVGSSTNVLYWEAFLETPTGY